MSATVKPHRNRTQSACFKRLSFCFLGKIDVSVCYGKAVGSPFPIANKKSRPKRTDLHGLTAKREMTLDHGCKPTIKGHFCSLLVSNIICLSSLSTIYPLSRLDFGNAKYFDHHESKGGSCFPFFAWRQKVNFGDVYARASIFDLNNLSPNPFIGFPNITRSKFKSFIQGSLTLA